ncbi:SIR2 family NAD-dependent protein deacylase [Porphyromonas canoris]|uniref:SIR2 family NAD-dependent protein deacylase n=1 Tax=Porphyromonas canoris TaxID=36875 RepID=UPI001F428804|nr:SIR2 family protein [Porphyromonas canoris]
MIGAGFSKNAEMDDTTRMKDWVELADDFYEILYGAKPGDQDVKYKSVLRLASQVEASRGRGVLDSLLQSSLPDERVYPGRLHIDLMRLPWSDVFTTNYDTLLEKAFIEAERYYYKVTNKETLLYAPHPRLVKLHGSFPDIRPFIITEENYRTYPQRFPEFVNTVRQSLIENILCLIGFSGDDPNFLSWIGWLRDVMGSQVSPVYQITYNTQLHDSNIHLSHDLGLDIINLADIKDIEGFPEALDFFFTYVGKEYSTKWIGKLEDKHRLINNRESSDIDTLITKMIQVREAYPGWIVLPVSHMEGFSDTKEDMPFWSNIYAECPDTFKRIEFLYEINWRIDTALGSFDIEWYLQALEQLPLEHSEILEDGTRQKLLGLKLFLLNAYRIKGEEEDYAQLLSKIEAHISKLTYEQNRLLTYIKCLYAISTLNYADVQKNTDSWSLRSLDYQGHLWKAGILIEIGQLRESEVMLRDLLKSVKRNILTSRYSSHLASVRFAIELFLWRIDNTYSMSRPKPTSDFDFTGIVRHCRDMINKEDNRPSQYQITHDFNLLEIGQQWNLEGGGFKGDYYGAIRYFQLYEKLGLPFGIPNLFSSDVDNKTFMIERLLRYYPKYALQWIVRCCNTKSLNALTRESLRHIRRSDACVFFDNLIESCEAGLEQYAGQILQTRVLTSLLPVLVKLSTLLPQDRIERIFNMLCIVYRQYPRRYERTLVRTLYNNLSGEYLKRCQEKALKEPILQSGIRGEDFEMPELWINAIEYPTEAGDIARTGLRSTELSTQQAAFERLKVLMQTKADDITLSLLDDDINTWRAIPPLSDEKLASFFMFPGEESTMRTIGAEELNSFLSTDFRNDGSTSFIDAISNRLFRLQIGFPRFTKEQHLAFLGKVVKILTENEDRFKKNDSEEFLGGFHNHVKDIFRFLNHYSQVEGLPEKDCHEWKPFKEVIERYHQYEYPVLTIITHLSYLGIWDNSIAKKYIKKSLFFNSRSLVYDAGNALVYMAEKQGKKVNQSIIISIINKITYVIDENTHVYLYIIRELLLKKGIGKKARIQLEEWINILPDRIEHLAILEEIKDDVRYYANQISGIMSVVWPDWIGLRDWRDYVNNDCIKNDVRNGFEVGAHLAASLK